jgi:hypothetical protein
MYEFFLWQLFKNFNFHAESSKVFISVSWKMHNSMLDTQATDMKTQKSEEIKNTKTRPRQHWKQTQQQI